MTRLARPLLVVLVSLIPAAWAEPGTAQKIPLQAEVERLRGYQARQKLGGQVLDGISRSLPELLWLDRLNVSGAQIVIDGRSFNTNAIANFIENLDKLPELSEPSLQSTSQQPNKTYKFTIRLGTLPARNKASKAELDSLLHELASQSEMPKVLQRLRALLEHPGIKVENFEPLPLRPAGKGRGEQMLYVEIRIGAESYESHFGLVAWARIISRNSAISAFIASTSSVRFSSA